MLMNTLLETDSTHDNDIIVHAIREIRDVEGMTCELGVRRGGGTKLIIDSLVENNDLNRHHIAIDPYGNIDFPVGNIVRKYDYDNHMRRDCLANLYRYVNGLAVNLHFFVLEDTEFFERYYDGVPTYNLEKTIQTKYALVILDGPHDTVSIKREFDFFRQRALKGSIIIFDDILMYPHDRDMEPYILKNGYELSKKGTQKAAYMKL